MAAAADGGAEEALGEKPAGQPVGLESAGAEATGVTSISGHEPEEPEEPSGQGTPPDAQPQEAEQLASPTQKSRENEAVARPAESDEGQAAEDSKGADASAAPAEKPIDEEVRQTSPGPDAAEDAAGAGSHGAAQSSRPAETAQAVPSSEIEKEEKPDLRPAEEPPEGQSLPARTAQSLAGTEATGIQGSRRVAALRVDPRVSEPSPEAEKAAHQREVSTSLSRSRAYLSRGSSETSPQEPLLQAPLASSAPEDMPVVVTREEVAEAMEDMRRYGASLVRPVAEAMEATRAHGAVALERGAEAASEARRHGNAALRSGVETAEALRKAGAQAAQTSAEMLQQGTEVARANWQHGAEACQRGLTEASAAWKRAAPYLDKAILLVNVACALIIGGFLTLGVMLVCMPLKPSRMHHGAFDRMFWVTQGLYLVAFSVPALVATVQCGILREGFDGWPAWMRVELWLGILKFQVGRAIFFIGAGFYVFPLMANFGLMADVELWTVILSYFLGILSLLSGSFLLIFEGLLSVYVRQALYDRVPQGGP